MATSKGKILKEQITFDFFNEVKVVIPTKQKKEKVIKNREIKKEKQEVKKQTKFRKNNIKPNHRRQNRQARKIF